MILQKYSIFSQYIYVRLCTCKNLCLDDCTPLPLSFTRDATGKKKFEEIQFSILMARYHLFKYMPLIQINLLRDGRYCF